MSCKRREEKGKEAGKMKKQCSIHKVRDVSLECMELQDHYEIIKNIASGDFGEVFLAVHKETKSEVALKASYKSATTTRDFLTEFHYSYFLSPHTAVLNSYDVAFETSELYVFAQEVAPLGDLWKAVEKSNGLSEADAKTVARQVTSALEFIHSQELVHRDVRAENVLVFKPDFSQVKLGDFSHTRRSGTMVKKWSRSLPTCPPELWKTMRLEGYTVEIGSDVWQMAMLILGSLNGHFPWSKADITDSNYTEFLDWQKRKTTKIPKEFRRYSHRFLRLLRRLMDQKPSKRYDVAEVYKYLNDRWVICRSPRAGSSRKDGGSGSVDEGQGTHLKEMLSNLGVDDKINDNDKEQRVQEWIMSTTRDHRRSY